MSFRTWNRAFALAVFAALGGISAAAHASGFSFGENGVRALSMGGAFVGQADDPTAIQHNPAGLVQLSGFHFLVDGQLAVNNVDFQRTNANGDNGLAESVSNSAGPFIAPMAVVTYGFQLAERPFTVALGVYGPPAVGRYTFPSPNYTLNAAGTGYQQNPIRTAPQRFSLISKDTLLIFPTLSVAYAVHSRFAIGASLQYVYSHFKFSQVISAALFTEPELQEDPQSDNIATVDLSGRPTVTGILGVFFQPLQMLSLGASVRPPIALRGAGTLDVQFGKIASIANSSLSGNQATLALTMPLELKVGGHLQVTPSLGVNADVVYETWSSLDEIVLSPQDIVLTSTGRPNKPLDEVHLTKHWHNTVSLRAGVEYAFGFGLSLRGGFLFEQGASPPEYVSIDFPHFTRTFLTAGAGFALGPVELVGAFAFLPTGEMTITNSQVNAYNALGIPGAAVGNGVYNAGGFIGSIGIRGHLGSTQKGSTP